MRLFIQIFFVFFSFVGVVVGSLMMFVPTRFPAFYAGFLNENVMRRQPTEKDRALAIRTQGLVWLVGGGLSALFVWAF
jgi:hypothetical protein